MRGKFKKSILEKFGSLSKFCTDNNFRYATVCDFLNGKTDIQYTNLENIMLLLEMKIQPDMGAEMTELNTVMIDGISYKKGQVYKDRTIVSMYGSGSTSHQLLILQNGDKFSLENV